MQRDFSSLNIESMHERAIVRELEIAKRSRLLDISESRRLEHMRLAGTKSKSNVGGSPFNIINLQYDHSHDGQRLRRLDEVKEFRRKLRSAFLAKKNHFGFDPITGCMATPVAI